jgi:hypothetical protein
MFYVVAYLAVSLVFCFILSICMSHWRRQAASDTALAHRDFDDLHRLLLSGVAASGQIPWQLEIMDELIARGYSPNAEKLLIWMDER